MAKFLNTQAITHELTQLIIEAKEKIVLVSYSLKVNPLIKDRIKTKASSGSLKELIIIYGNADIKEAEFKWMGNVKGLKTYKKINLHAKCYYNENKAIVCSMNLHDYSQSNNVELGIMINKDEDTEAYNKLVEEINFIRASADIKPKEDFEIIESVQKIVLPDIQVAKSIYDDVDGYPYRDVSIVQGLKELRKLMSKKSKTEERYIFTDQQIERIASISKKGRDDLFDILESDKVIKYGDEILLTLARLKGMTIGTVTDVLYKKGNVDYNKVLIYIHGTDEEVLLNSVGKLPNKGRQVAANINKVSEDEQWLNEYFYYD